MGELKALIFDVDGTLAETERDGHRVAFNQAFAILQLDWHWSVELYSSLTQISGGKERLRYYLENDQADFPLEQPIDEFVAELHQIKTQLYRKLLMTGSIPLRLGVKRLIKEAKKEGIRLAIATTSTYPNALALIEKHLDPSWFEIIAAGDIVPQKKPAPDIYDYVLEKMNLEPQDCLVFEDTEHGLMAATQAELQTIVTLNDYTKNQDFSQALCVLDHLGEPNHYCQVLQGNQLHFDYVTIEQLRQLVEPTSVAR